MDLPASRLRPAPYVLLLAGAVVCSGALLIALGSRVSFDLDDWVVLIQHPGLLEPHVGHNIVSIATIYRFIQETFGMSSIVPSVVFATLCFLAAAVVLFIWLRERVGNWLALAGAVSILFLGSAHEDLLVPFQISFYVPVACGLGAMLALARRTTKADVLAAALLTYSLTYNGLGLAFTVGCAILLAFDRGDRRRLWVTAVPVVLFALWYLGWGHTDPQSHRSWANLADSPIFILDGFASAVAALAGLATQRDEAQISPLDWGRPLLALLVVCGAVLAIRARRAHPGLWAALGAGLTFWFLVALNADVFRQPTYSRYMYPGAIFVLMIAAELLRGVRLGRWALIAVFAILALTVVSNLDALREAYDRRSAKTPVIRGGLGGLDIAAASVDPGLILDESNSDFAWYGVLAAGPYLAAAADYGSFGYSPTELESAPESARVAADKVLAAALGLRVETGPRRPPSGCRSFDLGTDGGRDLELGPGGAVVVAAPGADAKLALRRFAAASFPIGAGRVGPGQATSISIPSDSASDPWELRLSGRGRLSVCAPRN